MTNRNALRIAIGLLSIPVLVGTVGWSEPNNTTTVNAGSQPANQPVIRQHMLLSSIGNSLVSRNDSEQTRRAARDVVEGGKLIRMTAPEYPIAAKQFQVSGVVTVQARIGKDGRVVETSVLRGPYPLRKVAEDAVKHWQYEPTLLNGEPVQRVALVNLKFVLGRYAELASR